MKKAYLITTSFTTRVVLEEIQDPDYLSISETKVLTELLGDNIQTRISNNEVVENIEFIELDDVEPYVEEIALSIEDTRLIDAFYEYYGDFTLDELIIVIKAHIPADSNVIHKYLEDMYFKE